MPAEDDGGHGGGTSDLECVRQRLGPGTGRPSVLEGQHVNGLKRRGHLGREPVGMKVVIIWTVTRVDCAGDPGQPEPAADKAGKRMCASAAAGTRHGDDVRREGTSAERYARKMVAQKEQQEREQAPLSLLGRSCALVRPQVVVVLPGAWRVGDR